MNAPADAPQIASEIKPLRRNPLSRIWISTWLFGAILLVSVVLPLPKNGQILNLGSPCGLLNLTGVPCPGCGLTRSFVATAHGQLHQAVAWHPLGPFLWILAFVYVVTSLFLVARNRTIVTGPRVQLGALLALGVLMGVFWVLRLQGTFPLPQS